MIKNQVSTLNSSMIMINPLVFKGKLVLKALWVLTFLTILSLLVISIFQLNAYIKEIYLIKNYEKKLNQLSQENKILEVDFSKADSLKNIGNYVQNFEKADKVEYIRVLESTVAVKLEK